MDVSYGSASGWKDPGIELDKVFSLSHESDQCLLYRLANYNKGGELIDAYRIGGGKEVEKLIREQFSMFMYCDGRGQKVTKSEYFKWKLRSQMSKDCVIRVQSASSSRFDPLGRWSDHEACWKMEYRGDLGETLLHVLLACNSRAHSRIAKLLIKCFPRLAIDVFEGEQFLGASGLHLAIAYGNSDIAALLLGASADVSQKASGSFFLPRDQQRQSPASITDYEGLAYFGETPLNWAASCKNETCYNLLLEHGANPDDQDSFGNMVLHMIVIGDRQDEGKSEEMFGYALRHPRRSATNGIVNASGLTPLSLACRLARSGIFREMLELTCVEFWRYSNHTCSGYQLTALDTISPDGRTS